MPRVYLYRTLLISILEMKQVIWSFLLVLLSQTGLEAQIKVKGIDDYNNVRVQLTLHPNGEYTLEETYLDGSFWNDRGKWKQTTNQISLFSSSKSKREHNYLRFKSRKKFNGDTFDLQGEQFIFNPTSSSSSNKHYKELKWHKATN